MCRQAPPAARAPYKPDAAQSAERSFVAEAPPTAVVQPGLPIGPPWSALVASAPGSSRSWRSAAWNQQPVAVGPQPAELRVVGQSGPLEPRIAEEWAVPEP
jgi:hypothetical protein